MNFSPRQAAVAPYGVCGFQKSVSRQVLIFKKTDFGRPGVHQPRASWRAGAPPGAASPVFFFSRRDWHIGPSAGSPSCLSSASVLPPRRSFPRFVSDSVPGRFRAAPLAKSRPPATPSPVSAGQFLQALRKGQQETGAAKGLSGRRRGAATKGKKRGPCVGAASVAEERGSTSSTELSSGPAASSALGPDFGVADGLRGTGGVSPCPPLEGWLLAEEVTSGERGHSAAGDPAKGGHSLSRDGEKRVKRAEQATVDGGKGLLSPAMESKLRSLGVVTLFEVQQKTLGHIMQGTGQWGITTGWTSSRTAILSAL